MAHVLVRFAAASCLIGVALCSQAAAQAAASAGPDQAAAGTAEGSTGGKNDTDDINGAGASPPTASEAVVAANAVTASPVHQLKGKVSYYGKAFSGHRTACGGRFDHKAMTMAHRTLPCGSLVRVINLRNGKSVLVRVNDHGPNVKGRVADLSSAAAARMGLLQRGVMDGRLEVVKFGEASPGRPGR